MSDASGPAADIFLSLGGAHTPVTNCAACGQPWPCEASRAFADLAARPDELGPEQYLG